MNRPELDAYARTLLDENGLTNWQVRWRDLTRLFAAGRTRPDAPIIELCVPFFALANEYGQLDTIRHEVAHAVLLVETPKGVSHALFQGPNWHGPRWKFIAAATRATPDPYVTSFHAPPWPYIHTEAVQPSKYTAAFLQNTAVDAAPLTLAEAEKEWRRYHAQAYRLPEAL